MADPHTPGKNRRRAMRRTPKARVRVTCRRGALDLGPNLALSIVELSEAGIRLVVKEALEPGRPVSVGLEAQTHPRPTVRVGRVVWCQPAGEGGFVTGIQFEKALPYPIVLQVSREPAAGLPPVQAEEHSAADGPQPDACPTGATPL